MHLLQPFSVIRNWDRSLPDKGGGDGPATTHFRRYVCMLREPGVWYMGRWQVHGAPNTQGLVTPKRKIKFITDGPSDRAHVSAGSGSKTAARFTQPSTMRPSRKNFFFSESQRNQSTGCRGKRRGGRDVEEALGVPMGRMGSRERDLDSYCVRAQVWDIGGLKISPFCRALRSWRCHGTGLVGRFHQPRFVPDCFCFVSPCLLRWLPCLR